MPYRQEQFVNGEIYHLVSRGIDDNLIFQDRNDYYRGIFSIYEFNSTTPIEILARRREIKTAKEKGDPFSLASDKRDRLAEILAFCLMPNHIHLLVRQLKEGGITKFMRKLGAGFGGYFNRKYKRHGYVFQNRYSSVHIKDDEQLKTVFVYIHANPASLIEPKWKEIGIGNADEVIRFLENYKWSSYPDYIGEKNFPSVTERDFILKVMGSKDGCKEFVENWIKYKKEVRELTNPALEK